MADIAAPVTTTPDISNTSSIASIEPFGFESSPLDTVDFSIGEDGELSISGLDNLTPTQEVQENKPTESTETVSDFHITDPFGTQDTSKLVEENAKLKERLEAVEKRFTETDSQAALRQQREEQKSKLQSAGFDDNQIDAILGIVQPSVETKQEDKAEVKGPTQEEIGREVGNVLQIYNGKDGRLSVEEMKPYVNYTYSIYPDLNNYPLTTAFRVAENAPFLNWLHANYPERMKSLNVREGFQVSEKLRGLYYSKTGKPISSLDHLRLNKGDNQPAKTQTVNNGSTVTNTDIRNVVANEGERSLGIPGGEVKPVNRNDGKPKSARQIAEDAINSLIGQ